MVWTLPDGRVVYAPDSTSWPDFPAKMPWEEDVEEIASKGAPINLVDNTETIDTMLFEHNCQYDYPSVEVCGGSADTGGTDSAGLDEDEGTGGCGCSTPTRPGLPGLTLLALGLLGLRRRCR